MPSTLPIEEAGLISVIIPCYNAEQTLNETVDSVIRQTYKKWEIIIINDGSTDNSQELAEKLTALGNIKVIHTPNRGVSNARNTGVENAKGEFLAFLDADDVWHPEKLQLQINYFSKQPLLGVCYSKVRFTSQSGKSLNQYSLVSKIPLSAYSLLVENHLCTSSNIMCRKQVFLETTGFDPGMNYAEDQEWLLRVALNSHWLIAGVPQLLVDYRTQTGSLSSSLCKMEQGWQALIQKVKGYAPDFVDQHYLRAQATYLRYLARRALRQGEPAQMGLNYMKRAILSDWTILITSPWRSMATLIALVCWWIAPTKHTAQLFQISKY